MLGKRRSDATFGLIGQSFLAAMTEELAEYQRLVVVLESQLIAPHKEQANAGGVAGLTLKRLLVWMVDPMERLKMLAIMAECCQEHKGGALISSVYRYTRHGDPSIAPLVQRLLEKVQEMSFCQAFSVMFELIFVFVCVVLFTLGLLTFSPDLRAVL